jgi:hypothetical protein
MSDNPRLAGGTVSLHVYEPFVESTPRAASLSLYRYGAVPCHRIIARVVWACGVEEGMAVTPQDYQRSSPANPFLQLEYPVGLSKTDFQRLRIVRLQKDVRVLPGRWPGA